VSTLRHISVAGIFVGIFSWGKLKGGEKNVLGGCKPKFTLKNHKKNEKVTLSQGVSSLNWVGGLYPLVGCKNNTDR